MKLLAPIAAIIAAASAGQIYNSAPQQESYANSAEIYQSQLEYQQQGLYNDQSQAYTGHASHETAYEGRPSKEVAKILSFVMEQDDHGYQYSYETENGIKAQEVGQAHKGTEAHGAYSYKGDDGQTYTVTYTADEHGFRPQGAHLPTPPPIPEAIAKSIEQNAKDEAAGIYDDGKYVEQHQEQESHQSQLHQSQGHHEIYQVQGHQSHQPQVHQSHHQVPQGHHQIQLNQAAIHQVQAPQTHHQQQSHYQHQQPSQVLQIVSQPYHRYEPSSFQHEGYSGHSTSEALYRKH